ncbi:ribosomal protein L7/L12 [Luteimonas vadosa]|uniref:Large ribosomal subunit protein bL12 C-terminal domain-containing protein n=1 Tax=Luteimonas vadosa TaxID=1165507 RepID=A0ABP9DU34_9GAMM
MESRHDGLRDGQAAIVVAAALQEKGIAFPPEAAAALESGNLIAAIKLVREANPGLGLKEAKEAVEGIPRFRSKTGADAVRDAASNDGARVPTVVEGDRGGLRWLVLLALVATAAAGWWWFSGAA